MRFHLGAGERVLSRAMRDTMQSTQFTASPGPYGMAYAFQENALANRRVLQHAGAQLGFASFLVLSPRDDLGIFVAQNAREGALRFNVVREVLDALVDSISSLPVVEPGVPSPKFDPAPYAGRFRHTGYTHSTFEKATWILGLRGGMTTVRPGPEPGTLSIDGQVWRHAPAVGQHMFVHPTLGWWVQGFLVSATGHVTHYVTGREVLERVQWWEAKRTLQLTLLAVFVLSLGTLLGRPVRLILRRQAIPGGTEPAASVTARRVVRACSGLWIVGLLALVLVLRRSVSGAVQFDYGPTWDLLVSLTLLQLAIASTALLVGLAIHAWRAKWWSPSARVALSLHACASIAASAALGYMNLIGYRW
jgi:hypothetical protein